jgi:signal transduction histidine kinase/ActR/RegA family two-component response regulator
VVAQRLEEAFTDLASVWLREGDSDVFTLASIGDWGAQAVEASGLPRQLMLPPDVAGPLMEGESHYLADLAQLDAPVFKPLVEQLDVRSAVVTPLTAEGALLGVVVSARREPDGFSAAERDFMSQLAVHVGLAVRQAQLYQDLQEAYDDVRQTQRAMMRQGRLRALGQMASGIAHDINNAISPVPLYTAIIQREGDLSEQARAHLATIDMAIRDVEETVTRMRQFYRRSEREEDLQPVDLNQTAAEAIELTSPRWRDVPQRRGVTIELETDFQEDLPVVMGNEGEIRQAVTNLILNAVDAMPEGGALTVRTREGGELPAVVVLEVRDTGVGMDEETQRRCLEPFFSTKGERGSGMGLATVYGTMQRHDGDVQVESALGEGTTMRLLFPVRQLTEGEAAEEPLRPAGPLSILCVDDEAALREALREALEDEGHAVALAESGRSGLEGFRAARERGEPFDVVITDLGMPEVSGRQVARTVKAEAPGTPVILLTGWGRQLSAENDVPAAVDLMLGKPPTIEMLNRALARVTSED